MFELFCIVITQVSSVIQRLVQTLYLCFVLLHFIQIKWEGYSIHSTDTTGPIYDNLIHAMNDSPKPMFTHIICRRMQRPAPNKPSWRIIVGSMASNLFDSTLPCALPNDMSLQLAHCWGSFPFLRIIVIISS